MRGKRNSLAGLVLACGLLASPVYSATFTEAAFVDLADTRRLGASVAIDGNTAVAGGPSSPVGGTVMGAIFVFSRTSGGTTGWEMTKRIDFPDATLQSGFGTSVALSGDLIAVGAPTAQVNGLSTGAVYVFARNQGGAGNWGLLKKINAGAFAASASLFGFSVGIAGDWIIVGTPADDTPSINSGDAYLFYRNQNGPDEWGLVKQLPVPAILGNAQVGSSVAISARYAVVGVPYETNGTGKAYVYAKDSGGTNNWGYVASLLPSFTGQNTLFGTSVSVDGDEILVGQHLANELYPNEGLAYVYRRISRDDNWVLQRRLAPHDRTHDRIFGTMVSLRGGLAVIAAQQDNNANGDQAGAIYVYARGQGGTNRWGQVAKMISANGSIQDLYGAAVATDGTGIVAGAPGRRGSGSATVGGFYLYPGASGVISGQLATTASDVPADQGGRVLLTWNAMLMDVDRTVVPKYSVWRRVPDGNAAPTGRIAKFARAAGSWEWLADVPSLMKPSYSYAAETLFDSTDGRDGTHMFMVVGHTADPNEFTEGTPIAVHSVDNLAPGAPVRLRAAKTGAAVTLAWVPNREPDLARYAVYRGAGAEVASTAPYAWTSDTAYVDAAPLAGEPWYAVRAADIHGNLGSRSAPVSAIPTAIADSPLPAEFALRQNAPNPFNPSTTIRFSLPAAGRATIAIYGVDGRLIRTLVRADLEPGDHEVVWDGADDSGRACASGTYVSRLVTPAGALDRRMTLAR